MERLLLGNINLILTLVYYCLFNILFSTFVEGFSTLKYSFILINI